MDLLKEKLKNRFKALAWHSLTMAGAVVLVVVLEFLLKEILPALSISAETKTLIVMVVGLVAAQITKFLNSNLPEIKKAKAETGQPS